MSFKAADAPQYKPTESTDLAINVFDPAVDRQPAMPPKLEPAKDNNAVAPNGDLLLNNPYAPAFNDLVVGPIKPATNTDALTDPFNPRFNTRDAVQPGTKTADGGPKPDVLVNPFDPGFSVLPQDKTKLPPQLDVDPFDPFRDWDRVPAIQPQPSSDRPATPPQPEVAPQPKEVKPQEVPRPARPANPVFNETNVHEAIKLAGAQNQPIIVVSTPDGKPDAAQQAAMQAAAGDAVFVNINFQNADRMMRDGLETTYYWQLANLCGANGKVDNLYHQPGFMGRFNASDFNAADPQGSLKAAAAGNVEQVFSALVRPPAPGGDPTKVSGEKPVGSDGAVARDQAPAKRSVPMYNENNVTSAVKAAHDQKIPMISYVDGGQGQANPNVTKALQYLSDQGLATTVAINGPRAEQMREVGLEQSHFYALKNAVKGTSDLCDYGGPRLNGFAAASLQPGYQFNPSQVAKPTSSPDEIISFLKNSGVDLSKNNGEVAVRALLEGKPIPDVQPPTPKADKQPTPPVVPSDVRPATPPQTEVRPATPPQTEVPATPPQTEVRPATPPLPETPPAQPTTQTEVRPQTPAAQPEVRQPATPPAEPVRQRDTTAEVKTEKAEEAVKEKLSFKVKTAEEAKKAIEEAKKRNLPLVAHSMTVICTTQMCRPTRLDADIPDKFAGEAVFLELPRGGVTVPEGKEFDELRAINDAFKVTNEDHKTELDLHVYNFNKDKSAFEQNDGGQSRLKPEEFLRGRLKKSK